MEFVNDVLGKWANGAASQVSGSKNTTLPTPHHADEVKNTFVELDEDSQGRNSGALSRPRNS